MYVPPCLVHAPQAFLKTLGGSLHNPVTLVSCMPEKTEPCGRCRVLLPSQAIARLLGPKPQPPLPPRGKQSHLSNQLNKQHAESPGARLGSFLLHSVECLPCKQEELSSDPQYLKLGVVVDTVFPVLGCRHRRILESF